MRTLIVSHPPLSPEYGAAQIALNLRAALAERGHDAVAWSPEPLPAPARRWGLFLAQRRALERFLAESAPFDVIDAPAITVSAEVARRGWVVGRSVQPELLYLATSLRAERRGTYRERLRYPLRLAHAQLWKQALLAGWRRSRRILCLGSLEFAWMRERYPAWAAKMAAYLSAPSPQDQAALAAVRRARRSPAPEQGLRFLWIGRWVPHKGTERLLHFVRERLTSHPRDRFTVAGCGPGVAVDIPAPWIENGTVRLLPSFQRPDLFTLLGEHDVGLFTSEVEGWGLCLNEMLEAGLRVVATQAGGLADLDSVLPGEILSFADVARLEEPWPPPGLLPATYRQRFSWPAIAASYEQAAMPRQHRCAC